MTIRSAPYYWAECDGVDCNSRTPNHEIQAWDTPDHVFDDHDSDWRTSDGGKHYCLDCWFVNDNDEIVFNDGRRSS